jgi:long-chain acyl-CoA synthetase
MAETEVRDGQIQSPPDTARADEAAAPTPADGKRALTAAGVTAAVLGGAALAVGVARSREDQAWTRLQEQVLDGAGTRQTAGDPSRPFPPITVPQMLRRTCDRFASKPALQQRVKKQWVATTYAELAERVMNFALGLAELGIRKGDRVAILSENRVEWAVADLAVLSIGAVTVPLYSTLPAAQVQHVVGDSGSAALVVEDEKQLKKALEVRENLPDLRHVVLIEPIADMPAGVATFAAIEAIAADRRAKETEFERLWHAVQPGDLASIIYTSGTTGLPKGAMLTHDNFMSNAQALPELVQIGPDDVFLSFLPLAHVFERLAGHYLPLLAGSTVVYSEGLRHLRRNMAEIEPTVMASVPRLYEGMQSGIQEEFEKRPARERKMLEWALSVGSRYNGPLALGRRPGLVAQLEYRVADRLVLSKIRARVSGRRLRYFISGGAPLAMDTARFFNALGWTILQGYGLTETSPVINVNRPGLNKFGTVGPPITAVEVRIADDGEILARGPNIMQGYYNLPEATAQAIDADGWFHTGDIGQLDAEGYLRITDRKKDLIVLANGKNVAPQPIESALKASPFIAWPALFGDRQPVIVALIVPDFARLKAWASGRGIPLEPTRELLDHPEVRRLYKSEIDAHMGGLADYEKVRRFALLADEFSIDSGELTPTLKVKRAVVADRYAGVITGLYRGGEG